MGTEYFRNHPLIGILSNLPVVLGAVLMVLLLNGGFRSLLERRTRLVLSTAFVVTRLVFLFLVVFVLRHVSLDLSTYFETQGVLILRGSLPYRDFASSYGPLFPYLMALPALFKGPVPFFLFFIVCDAITLILLVTVARREAPGVALGAGWLYVSAPVTWYFLVRYGQDEALTAAALMTAFLLARRGAENAAAIVLGLGFAATKFTFGIFIPPFALAARNHLSFSLIAIGTLVLAHLPFAVAGAPVWRPLLGESGALGAGPSLWRLLFLFTPLVAGWPMTGVLGTGLVVLWVLVLSGKLRVPLESHLILTGALFVVLSPKAMPMYVTPFWPFVALWLARQGTPGDIRLAALLNLLLGVWWYLDAGGVQGGFGPLVQALAVLVTAAIPVVMAILALRAAREGGRAGKAGVLHFEHVRS